MHILPVNNSSALQINPKAADQCITAEKLSEDDTTFNECESYCECR